MEELTGKKPVACNTGREKGAAAYAAGEHLALLSIMRHEPNSFNSSESSPQWGVVHQRIVEEYYGTMGFPPRPSAMLQTHFVELYSAFKLGIQNASLVAGSMRCPSVFVKGDQETVKYVESLTALLVPDGKWFHPKTWWSFDVVEIATSKDYNSKAAFSKVVILGMFNLPVVWLSCGYTETVKGKHATIQNSRGML